MTDHSAHHDSHGHAADQSQGPFQQAFDKEVQTALMDEDSEAWNNVTGELLTIVTCGVLFFAFVVWVISR